MGSIFDGISPNDRIFGSMVRTRESLRVRTASSAEDARRQVEIGFAPFIPRNDLF